MKFSRRTIIILLLFLVFVSIVFRYPTSNHEIWQDSFAIHSQANAISQYGYDKRVIHSLSLFGLYPYSYPTGLIYLLSGISQVTEIDMEHTILLSATIFGILGALFTFMLAKELLNNVIFAFSSAMLFSLSRNFLFLTTWTVNRGPFIAILPLFIWLLLRTYRCTNERLKYGILSIITLIILASIHRMAFFISFILMAFFISILAFKISKHLHQRIKLSKKITIVSFSIITFLLALLFIMPLSGWAFYGEWSMKAALAEGQYFIKGSGLIINLLNMGILYAMAFGILISLVPIGYFWILRKATKRFPNMFMISILFFFTFFWTDWLYARAFSMLFIALFSGMGLVAIAKFAENKLKKKYLIPIGMIILLLVAESLPLVITIPHGQKIPITGPELEEETYNCGLYLKYYNDGVIFSNYKIITQKIDAFSETNPYKIPDYFDKSKLERVPFKDLISGKYDYLFKEKKPYLPIERSVFNRESCYSQRVRNALDYNLQGNGTYYVLVMSYLGNDILLKDPSTLKLIERKSPFFVDLHEKTYKIYDDGFEHVMFLKYQ